MIVAYAKIGVCTFLPKYALPLKSLMRFYL